jgi:outer membrane receptor protein involved in Fe transport
LQTTRNTAFKAALLAGGAGVIALAQPAFAQDNAPASATQPTCNPQVDPTCAATPQSENGTENAQQGIVVTGSRIRKQDYQSNSPLVTADAALLTNSSTAAIEQNLNKLPEFVPSKTPTGINAGDIQPTATNTPGSANISLRGLGANRNLVLIDGRRGTPGNATGTVDINTIPSAAVERVEIITGGASATYGADAIGGVANFILKKNFQGLDLDGQMGVSQHGNGFEYQISGIIGSDFADGRGNVSLAISTNKRQPIYQRDLKWYRNNWANPATAGSGFFPPFPGVSSNGVNEKQLIAMFPGANLNGSTIAINDPTKIGTTETINGQTVLYQDVAGNYHCNYPGNANPIDSGICAPLNVSTVAGAPFVVNLFQNTGGFSIFANPDGSIWTGTAYAQRGGASQAAGIDGYHMKLTDIGTAAANDTYLYAQLPLTRYNFLGRANYEINDWIGVFGQGMFSHVHTHTVQEPGPIVGGWSVSIPYGNGIYTGSTQYGYASSVLANGFTNPDYLSTSQSYTVPGVGGAPATVVQGTGKYGLTNCPTAGGCPKYIVFPLPAALQTLMLGRGTGSNALANSESPVGLQYLFTQPRENFTDVDTYNLTGGFQGSIPGSDWTWELFVNHGSSSTYAIQTGVESLNRVRALFNAPNWGYGFSSQSNPSGGGFGANFATCTSGYDIFNPPAGGFSQDCQDAIRADLKNRSYIRQTIWEGNATGTLFNLPAGPLQAAIGLSYRDTSFKFTNDTLTDQGVSFQDQALGIYPSGDTTGDINVKELYGELEIPVLKDTFIRELTLELGGRISDYNTTGTSYTYKAQGNLALTDWLRFRGGYNRAERAPNIAELYLAPQQTFAVNALGDLCTKRATYRVSAGVGTPYEADVTAVCSAVMDRTAGQGAGAAYYGTPINLQPTPGLAFAFPTLLGNANLKPEKADTWTFGGVLRSPFSSPMLSRLQLSVDWFNIKIKDAIGYSAGNTLQTCFDPALNPLVSGAANNPAQAAAAAAAVQCAGVAYQAGPNGGAPGLGNIIMQYNNSGRINIAGIDSELDWSFPAGPGSVSLSVVGSYFLHYKVASLESNPMTDYAGTFGTTDAGLTGAAFRWQTLTTLGYSLGKANISLQWQHRPATKNSGSAVAPTPISGGPAYDMFNLNASYSVTDNLTVRAGIDNLFNTAPPLTGINTAANVSLGQQPGGSFNALYYDDLGRRFSLGANLKF